MFMGCTYRVCAGILEVRNLGILGVGAQGIWFSSEFSIRPFHYVSCAYDFGRIWAVCGGLSKLWTLCGYPKY